mmetsp:Transcript_20525/g.53044  ORF Transcript_20525/g.53044 Transcript_20525/m.53044 type:complete len:254 (-) Transcript_20525:410-1171(-)
MALGARRCHRRRRPVHCSVCSRAQISRAVAASASAEPACAAVHAIAQGERRQHGERAHVLFLLRHRVNRPVSKCLAKKFRRTSTQYYQRGRPGGRRSGQRSSPHELHRRSCRHAHIKLARIARSRRHKQCGRWPRRKAVPSSAVLATDTDGTTALARRRTGCACTKLRSARQAARPARVGGGACACAGSAGTRAHRRSVRAVGHPRGARAPAAHARPPRQVRTTRRARCTRLARRAVVCRAAVPLAGARRRPR